MDPHHTNTGNPVDFPMEDQPNQYNQDFITWFNGIEGFSLRAERFYSDLDICRVNPFIDTNRRYRTMTKWLEAAYLQGYNTGKGVDSNAPKDP